MTVSALLLAAICVAVPLLVLIDVYLLAAFSHPDDANQALFPKFLILLSFFLSHAAVLGLPLDVANGGASSPGCAGDDDASADGAPSACGGLDMHTYVKRTLLLLPLVLPTTSTTDHHCCCRYYDDHHDYKLAHLFPLSQVLDGPLRGHHRGARGLPPGGHLLLRGLR